MHGFMSSGASMPNPTTNIVTAQMKSGAVKIEKKERLVQELEKELEPTMPATEAVDYAKMPFFSLKKIAIEKGYQGEMKKQPILDFLNV